MLKKSLKGFASVLIIMIEIVMIIIIAITMITYVNRFQPSKYKHLAMKREHKEDLTANKKSVYTPSI